MSTDFYYRSMYYGADSNTLQVAARLRKNMTLAELVLWKRLKDRNIFNAKFRRQHPVHIFIVDFYCHTCKLAIEVDGEIHNDKKAIEYDKARTSEIEKYGIRIIRFTNYQVIHTIDEVIAEILKETNVSKPH